MKTLIVIPARGGSKGIPKKNIRLMGGEPLISYAIRNALLVTDATVVVSSDDDEILEIAEKYGAITIKRPYELADDKVTLDPVIENAVLQMEQKCQVTYDAVITMQPTSPLLSAQTLMEGIKYFIEGEYDTVISGVNQPHLSWKLQDGKYVPNYTKRLNRQYLPVNLVETGAFVITKREFVTTDSRFGSNVSIYEMPEKEALDIDTPWDWWIAETELQKKKVLIHVAGYNRIGTGHIYRCLQLAAAMIEHTVLFVVEKKSDIAIEMIRANNYPLKVVDNRYEIVDIVKHEKIDIVINDVLDTEMEYMKALNEARVRIINFEDLGEGAQLADAVINDIYEREGEGEGKYYWSSDYYIIKDEFKLASPKVFSEEVHEILLLFGGTDPNNLTKKTLQAILPILSEKNIHCTVILGVGYADVDGIKQQIDNNRNVEVFQDVKRISQYMECADIAISSRGRTMYELAYMGVPTVLLAQNERELEHIFGSLQNGYISLGMGTEIEEETLRNTINWLVECPSIRREMQKCLFSRELGNGLEKVKDIIFGIGEK